MAIKIIMLVIFFGVMIGVGVYCRKHATDVNGFVLGGRNIDIILFIIRACSRACFSRKFACCGKKRASNARNSDKKTANRHLPFCGVQ